MASKSALDPWLRDGRLVTLPVEDLDMGVEVEIAYRRAALSPAEQRMIDVVREVVSSQHLDLHG